MLPMDERIKRIWLFVFCVALALFAGFRGEGIDRDYRNYVSNFLFLQPPHISFIEPAFYIISSAIKVFSSEPTLLFLTFALISLSVKFLAIRRSSDNVFLSLLVLLSNIYIIQDLTQIRAAVGASLFLLALTFLVDGHKKKFYILAAVAVLFHYTSLIIFLFILADFKKIKIWFWALLIPVSYGLLFANITPLSLLSYIPIASIQSKLNTYIALQQEDAGKVVNVFNLLVLIKYLLILFLLSKIHELQELNRFAVLFLKVYILSIVALILTSKVSTLAFRLNEYLSVVEIVLLPMLTIVVRPKILSHVIIIIFCIILLFLHYRAETLLIFLQSNG